MHEYERIHPKSAIMGLRLEVASSLFLDRYLRQWQQIGEWRRLGIGVERWAEENEIYQTAGDIKQSRHFIFEAFLSGITFLKWV